MVPTLINIHVSVYSGLGHRLGHLPNFLQEIHKYVRFRPLLETPVLVQDLVKQRYKIVVVNLNDSDLLKRYQCVLGPGVDLPNVFLDGLLRCDVRHGFDMLVSPLVLFFHPLHPLRVGLIEGLQTG